MDASAAPGRVIRTSFGRACLDTRIALDLSQQQLADRVGVSRAHIARIEHGAANASIDLIGSIADALGLEIELVVTRPTLVGAPGQRDRVHAWCSGHVGRRLANSGWSVAREVEIVHGRSHGWIDLLAFDTRTGTLLIIEIKTRIDDLGAVERQVGWYERASWSVARGLGWEPQRVATWLLVLASEEVEAILRANREVLRSAFPLRAPAMLTGLRTPETIQAGARGLAMIDPAYRGRAWLFRTKIDGRRSRARYTDYASAVRRADRRT